MGNGCSPNESRDETIRLTIAAGSETEVRVKRLSDCSFGILNYRVDIFLLDSVTPPTLNDMIPSLIFVWGWGGGKSIPPTN